MSQASYMYCLPWSILNKPSYPILSSLVNKMRRWCEVIILNPLQLYKSKALWNLDRQVWWDAKGPRGAMLNVTPQVMAEPALKPHSLPSYYRVLCPRKHIFKRLLPGVLIFQGQPLLNKKEEENNLWVDKSVYICYRHQVKSMPTIWSWGGKMVVIQTPKWPSRKVFLFLSFRLPGFVQNGQAQKVLEKSRPLGPVRFMFKSPFFSFTNDVNFG